MHYSLGSFIGVGLGIIFRYGGTTGGVDIIAQFANKLFGMGMGRVMFIFDACVIALSILTYLDYREAMYTLVAVFIASRIIDFIQEGTYSARGAMIISEKNNEIAEKIMKEYRARRYRFKWLRLFYKRKTRNLVLRRK